MSFLSCSACVRALPCRRKEDAALRCKHILIMAACDVVHRHPFDTVKVRLQTQSSTNPLYCALHRPTLALAHGPVNQESPVSGHV